MRYTIVVNDPTGLELSQTTLQLIRTTIERGDEVYVIGVGDLTYTPMGAIEAQAYPTHPEHRPRALRSESPYSIGLDQMDVVFFFTDPAFDQTTQRSLDAALSFTSLLKEQGVMILNDPVGLQRARSMLFLQSFPADIRPPMLITRDPDTILACLTELNEPAVIMPLRDAHEDNQWAKGALSMLKKNKIVTEL